MPVTLRHTLPGGSLSLWRIDEDEARLAPLCTERENAFAATLAPGRRRREWLAWHAALHEEAPAEEAFYRPSGAPALRSGRHIAVSHADGYAALMLCDTPCGLDIERADRDFAKSEKKYLSPDERELLESVDGLSAGLVWCAKEALYKWAELDGLDWMRDIQITGADPQRGTLDGRVKAIRTTLHRVAHAELIVVFCAG